MRKSPYQPAPQELLRYEWDPVEGIATFVHRSRATGEVTESTRYQGNHWSFEYAKSELRARGEEVAA